MSSDLIINPAKYATICTESIIQDNEKTSSSSHDEFSLSPSSASMFQELQNRITEASIKVESLQNLRNAILENKNNSFDKEDLQIVDEHLKQSTNEVNNLKKELEQREMLYKNTILKLHQTLSVRQNVLENQNDKTQVLQKHPELLKKFANKQAQLVKTLKEMEELLLKPIGQVSSV